MSDRVALRLTGEIVYTPERQGLQVEITLAHVEEKLACVRKFRIPWQNTDFHNAVRFEVNRYMQEVGTALGSKLAYKAPTSYLDLSPPPKDPTSLRPVAPLNTPMTEPLPRRGRVPRTPVA